MKLTVFTLLMALLYFTSGHISFALEKSTNFVTLAVFIPEGLALAGVILFGRNVILGIFLGQMLLSLSVGFSLFIAFGIGLTNALEALIALVLTKHFNIKIDYKNPSDVYVLFAFILLIFQPFSAIMGVSWLYIGGEVSSHDFFNTVLTWWFGNTMGQILLTPATVMVYRSLKKHDLHFNYIAKSLAVLLFIYWFIYTLPLYSMALLMSFTIPYIMLLVSRYGIVYGAIMVLFISFVSITEGSFEIGIFQGHATVDFININFFIIAHIVITYTYGLLFLQKEQALKKLYFLNRDLERRVAQEVEKNRKKDEYLLYQSRLAQMGEIINMIAHQWRQPLNTISIINQAIVLKYKKNKLDDHYITEFDATSREQISYMSETINDFRDFFKPEKNKEPFLLNETIKHTLSLMEKSFTKNGITLHFKEARQNITVYGYPNEFSQALMSILNNAKEAFFQKEHKNGHITVNLYSKEHYVHISILDNAGGIDETIMHRIFEPYFSTKDEHNGTGLGLHMARMIIQEHMQGTIYAKNRADGAEFIIRLKQSKEL